MQNRLLKLYLVHRDNYTSEHVAADSLGGELLRILTNHQDIKQIIIVGPVRVPVMCS